MKTINIFAIIGLAAALLVCATVRAEPAASAKAAAAWKELQQAAVLPKAPLAWKTNPPTGTEMERFQKQVFDLAMAAAGKAMAFYTQFPSDTNALSARKLQCEMLTQAFSHGEVDQETIMAWGDAQEALLAQPGLTDEERYDLRLAIIKRKTFDQRLDQKSEIIEREKALRELIKDYPTKDLPYEKLLTLAANAPADKARSIANEVMALSISEGVRAKAEGILRGLDAVGKPLDIKFTATDGREVDLSQMKDKVVLIDFWATWCVPCIREIPQVKEVYERFHYQGFEVIGISFDDNEKGLKRFIQENELPWPQYFDGKTWDNKIGFQYGIKRIPQLWLVDKKGNLRDKNAADNLQSKVEKLLTE